MEELEGEWMGLDGVRDEKGRRRGCTMTEGVGIPACTVIWKNKGMIRLGINMKIV